MHPALRYWLFQLPGLAVLVMLLGFALRHGWITIGMAGLAVTLWIVKDAILYIPWSRSLHRRLVPMGRDALVGRAGTAVSRIDQQHGHVRVNGENWQATCAGPSIEPGTRVRVRAVDGMQLQVERND